MIDDRLCLCKFPIVLKQNDGSEQPPAVMLLVFQSLRRQFPAYTMLGVRDGVWEGQTEPSLWLEVSIPQSRVPELRELVYSIGKLLGQKAMYFDAPPPTVEIIPIEESTDEQRESSAGEGG